LDKNEIDEIPSNVPLRIKLLKDTFPDNEMLVNHLSMYTLLTKLRRAPHTKREEFRRHVTMIATIDNAEVVEMNIDKLGEHYAQLQEFLRYVRDIVHGKDE